MGFLEALAAAIEQHVIAIKTAAWDGPPGGGAAWDALLRHYGIPSLSPEERALIASRMQLVRGATPAEVRMALVGLERWARAELTRLGAVGSAQGDLLEHRLANLVAQETTAYEHSLGLMPQGASTVNAPSLASIFANAHETAKDAPWANVKAKAVASLTCVHCGGPQEAHEEFLCRYCRRPIAGAIRTPQSP